ncbi:hypothetical protein AB0D11_25635 [Streptomyces monashensis]|uniref:hypothetical protein n=1 Tax=Streptomyces monashensis TaxID=1678012 RepID=UPI0033D45B93
MSAATEHYTPTIKEIVEDSDTGRIGEVEGHVGPNWQLRPLHGGREWDVRPEAIRQIDQAQALSAKARAANRRSEVNLK